MTTWHHGRLLPLESPTGQVWVDPSTIVCVSPAEYQAPSKIIRKLGLDSGHTLDVYDSDDLMRALGFWQSEPLERPRGDLFWASDEDEVFGK